jgi:protocatechuate 3,4-dioxygenase beta subunit
MMSSLIQPRAVVVALMIVCLAAVATAQPPQGPGRGGRAGGRGPGPAPGGPPRQGPPRDAAAGQVASGTAVISGSVTVTGTGLPARRARVTLNSTEGGGSRTAMTDDEGRYAFTGLASGRYSLSASKSGHVGVTYGQTRPGRPGTPIQLADGEKFAASLELPRGSVVTGTVLDEYGEPTPGIQVRVMRYLMQAGRRTLQQSGTGSTDDRGIYRVFGLQPGEYIVSAVPRNTGPAGEGVRLQAELEAVRARIATAAADQAAVRELASRAAMLQSQVPAQEEQTTGYAPVYYPGTVTAAQAAAVILGVGEERANIDFQLQRVPLARIDGMIVNSTGQATDNVQITLTDAGQSVPGVGGMSARADAEGRFRLANVPPGTYRLIVRATVPQAGGAGAAGQGALGGRGGRGFGPLSTAIRLWGGLDLQVEGRNLTNVMVPLQQGLTVSGRVAFQGATLPPPTDLTRLRVNLTPADPAGGLVQPAAGTVDATGKFTIASVVPGVYRLMAGGAGNGWFLESSMVDGQDSLDFPFEVKSGSVPTSAVVTFTDHQAQLTGRITNQRGEPAPEQTLIIYPADERLWAPQSRRIRSTRPATDGQFTFSGIPPGDYKLVALVDVETGAWFDPTFLQQVDAASTRITVGEGEKKVQNLQITSR